MKVQKITYNKIKGSVITTSLYLDILFKLLHPNTKTYSELTSYCSCIRRAETGSLWLLTIGAACWMWMGLRVANRKRRDRGTQKRTRCPHLDGLATLRTRRHQLDTQIYNIKTIFKPNSKDSEFLPAVKDKNCTLQSQGVYRISCYCGSVYIGVIKRSVNTRITEQVTSSALAGHRLDTYHQIPFRRNETSFPWPRFYPRKVREAIEISRYLDNLYRDKGNYLCPCWKSHLIATCSLSHRYSECSTSTANGTTSLLATLGLAHSQHGAHMVSSYSEPVLVL